MNKSQCEASKLPWPYLTHFVWLHDHFIPLVECSTLDQHQLLINLHAPSALIWRGSYGSKIFCCLLKVLENEINILEKNFLNYSFMVYFLFHSHT